MYFTAVEASVRSLTLRELAASFSLLLVCAGAAAQAPDKPGPMQSGGHAAEAPAEQHAAGAQSGAGASPATKFDVDQLFASTCGWCHSKGGREAGKGPQLMGTQLTDSEIISRIRNGKPGQMPAFGSAFNDEQLKAIVSYIRELKP